MRRLDRLALPRVLDRASGPRRAHAVLAAVLFTGIVGSTQQVARVGDRRWRQLLDVHDEFAARLVEEAGGRLVKTTGDGILATFNGPARAIRCAADLRDALRGMGLQLRAGIHAGEVELRDGDVGGIAVHIAARVMAAARSGEILLQNRTRSGGGLRPHPGGARGTPVEGRRGHLAALRIGGHCTGGSGLNHDQDAATNWG